MKLFSASEASARADIRRQLAPRRWAESLRPGSGTPRQTTMLSPDDDISRYAHRQACAIGRVEIIVPLFDYCITIAHAATRYYI